MSEEDKMNANLKALIDEAKKHIFNDPSQATDADTLGVMVSKYHKWQFKPITETIRSALEDANFHTLNTKFSNLIGIDS